MKVVRRPPSWSGSLVVSGVVVDAKDLDKLVRQPLPETLVAPQVKLLGEGVDRPFHRGRESVGAGVVGEEVDVLGRPTA